MDYWLWVSIALAVLALYLGWRKPMWSGVREKTAWNWLQLLLVPTTVSFATFLISTAQHQIEADRLQEVAVQQYIDRVSELSLTSNGEMSDAQIAVGRAHTVAVFTMISGERAGRVVVFLQEIGLLSSFTDDFEGVDFRSAELKNFDFSGVEFEGADFREADLEDGVFIKTEFEDADLTRADLDGADMRDADFSEAKMAGAELSGTDLRGADLSGAIGLNTKALSDACYDETTKLPPNVPAVSGPTQGCFGSRDRDSDD